jgi:hypothetical protein
MLAIESTPENRGNGAKLNQKRAWDLIMAGASVDLCLE